MKWQNRGHEFDEIGSVFQANQQIYVYGLKQDIQAIIAQLAFLGTEVRSLTPLPGHGSGLKKILTLVNWLRSPTRPGRECLTGGSRGKIVLLPECYAKDKSLMALFREKGFEIDRTLFLAERFLRTYLPVYALYVKNLIYFPDISFIPSTKCNLNCKCCLNFTPFLKKMEDEPVARLKQEVDLFFSKVDYIGMFHISGGEPLLYPQLGELLAYIGQKYRQKIHDLAVTTNGTRNISDELLCILGKYHISVICDDYTSTLPQYKVTLKKLISDLKNKNICHRVNKVRRWIDLAPDITDNSGMSDDELIRFCTACAVPWSEYHSGRLYACNYAHYAEKAGLSTCDATEYLDFATLSREQARELIEFRAGFTEKGYTEFCKRCAGFNNNPYRRIPAEQATRRG